MILIKDLKRNKMKQTSIEWLIEKHFGSIAGCTPDFRNKIEQAKELHKQEQDEFAIGFAEWIRNMSFGKYHSHSTKELLEIYKKEKGL